MKPFTEQDLNALDDLDIEARSWRGENPWKPLTAEEKLSIWILVRWWDQARNPALWPEDAS